MRGEARTFRRKVLMRCGSRDFAEQEAENYALSNPDGEYAVEYTPVVNQRRQWRVIKIDTVPVGTPDVHPRCDHTRRKQRDQIHDMWDSGDGGFYV